MSKTVNIFALFGIFSMAACVALAPPSTQPAQETTLGCGVVNFMVTTYLPRPHAEAFCSAYLQEPKEWYTSTSTSSESSPSSQRDGHSLVPATTQKAFRQATIPEFNWLRERKLRSSPDSTIIGKACSCLSTSTTTPKTAVIAAAVAPTASKEKKAHTSLFQPQLVQTSQGSHGNSVSPLQSQATEEAAVFRKRAVDSGERELKLASRRLGFASSKMMDQGLVGNFNGTVRGLDVVGGGRLELLKALDGSL